MLFRVFSEWVAEKKARFRFRASEALENPHLYVDMRVTVTLNQITELLLEATADSRLHRDILTNYYLADSKYDKKFMHSFLEEYEITSSEFHAEERLMMNKLRLILGKHGFHSYDSIPFPASSKITTPKVLVIKAVPAHQLRKITCEDETKTTAEWEKLTGIKSATILSRIRSGWTTKKALTIPTKITRTVV